MTCARSVLRAWASDPEIAALPETERLARAERELGLHVTACPRCRGAAAGCRTCAGHGVMVKLRTGASA